ncbi:hypothetical protein ABZ400_33170 [Streptomyces sp. NPDC005897]|uniref:hypothetical protein n=1 Tax=Streptomyces sp. NPDC005897 TaxID=3157081 RepID=UPI0033C2A2A6
MTEGGRPGTDVGGGHIGVSVTIIALIVITSLSDPRWALITAGCFGAWFLVALAVIIFVRGGNGREAVRRAYVATFGWGDYITP